jgi:hypothetical protein
VACILEKIMKTFIAIVVAATAFAAWTAGDAAAASISQQRVSFNEAIAAAE